MRQFIEAEQEGERPFNWGKFFVEDLDGSLRLYVDLQTREACVVNRQQPRRDFLRHPVHVCILFYPLLEVLRNEVANVPLGVKIPTQLVDSQPGSLLQMSRTLAHLVFGPTAGTGPFYVARRRNREVSDGGGVPIPAHVEFGRRIVVRSTEDDSVEEHYLVHRFSENDWRLRSTLVDAPLLAALKQVRGRPLTPACMLVLDAQCGRGFLFDPEDLIVTQHVTHPVSWGKLLLSLLSYLSEHHGNLEELPPTVVLPPTKAVRMAGPEAWCWRPPLPDALRDQTVPEEEDGQSVVLPEESGS